MRRDSRERQSIRYAVTERKKLTRARGSTQVLETISSRAVWRAAARWLQLFRTAAGGNAFGDLCYLMTAAHLGTTPQSQTFGTDHTDHTETPKTNDTKTTDSALPAYEMLKDAAVYSLAGGFSDKALLKFVRGVHAAGFKGAPTDAFDIFWIFAEKRLSDPELCKGDVFELFQDTLSRIKPMTGTGLDAAICFASTAEPPAGLEGKIGKLANVCLYLQRLAKREPFYLSARAAARAIGMKSPFHAAAFLRQLERKEFIKTVTKGANAGRKATRFHYLK